MNTPITDIEALGKRLTERQLRFVHEYLADPEQNAARAYEKAGYKAKGQARYTGASKLLEHPKIKPYLEARKLAMVQRSGLSLDRLTRELEAICFSDPRELFQENGALKNLSTLDESTARAVSGVELGDKVKITLWDKLGAIEKALKLLNAYPDRKQEVQTHTIVGVVVLPAKGSIPHAGAQRASIEGQAKRIERVAPEAPKAKAFKVTAAR